MRTLSLVFGVLTALVSELGYASPNGEVDRVYPEVCSEGVHRQPSGEFAAYVFCDDAQGSNIAVMHLAPGDSEYRKWPIDRRFWQGEEWAKDVDSFGWIPNRNMLAVATSEVYGAGSVFLLDLVNQTYSVLSSPPNCGASLVSVSEEAVTARLSTCADENAFKTVVLRIPATARR